MCLPRDGNEAVLLGKVGLYNYSSKSEIFRDYPYYFIGWLFLYMYSISQKSSKTLDTYHL